MSFENTQFIDSPNSDVISLHDIRLPFPPPFITVSDFINKRESSSRIFRKSPNAFFIYRKAFTTYLTLLNYKLTMIDVSKLVSDHWKKESKEVKEGYAKIAKEIDVELKEKRKHDKKLPVIWKIDKKSKKQKKISRRNLNNSTNNSLLTKFKNNNTSDNNPTEITFEFQNFSIPVNEPLRCHDEEKSSQSSLGSSPNSSSPLMEFPGIIQYSNFYENSCKSSNESEEESQPAYNLNACDQNFTLYRLNAIDNPEYNNFVSYELNINDNIFPQYNWDMSINNENLARQQFN